MLKENTKAPEISLPDQDGKIHNLSDFLGSWVLVYFYPMDDTPGCTKEACAFRDNLPNFNKLGVNVFGISTDSQKSHEKFIQKYGLNFTLLSDEENTVSKKYGSVVGNKRISYLIDPDGVIKKAYSKVKPETHAEEVERDVKKFVK